MAATQGVPLQTFLQIPIECIKIEVIKFSTNIFTKTTYEVHLMIHCEDMKVSIEATTLKRYTEFQGFYDSLVIRYQNIKFPKFPSKFQILDKEQSRKKFFDSLVKTVIKMVEMHPQIKNDLLKIIYEFTLGCKDVDLKELTSFQVYKYFTPTNEGKLSTSFDAFDTKSVTSSNSVNLIHRGSDENNMSASKPGFCLEKQSSVHPLNDTSLISSMFPIQEKEEGQKTEVDGWLVQLKFRKNEFTEAYVKIFEQCLWVYESIVANNFSICLPIYKINYDVYRIRGNERKYIHVDEIKEANEYLKEKDIKIFNLEDLITEIDVKIYHSFDNFEFVIKFASMKTDLCNIWKFLEILETNSNATKSCSKYISPIDISNLNIYGKLYLEIEKVDIPSFEGDIFVKILLPPYSLKTKSILQKVNFSVKQIFFIPLHNRFETIKFEVHRKNYEGLFQKKVIEEKLCEATALVPEVLNNYFFSRKSIDVEMENLNKNLKNVNKITLHYKLINCSGLLALAMKCRNKNILEDMDLYKSEEDFSMKNLMKRLKKMLYLIKDFKEGYKTVFRFQYPMFSSLLMLLSVLYFIFCETKFWITHLIFFVLCVIFSYSNLFRIYISPFTDKYIFSFKNPYDVESYFISTKVDVETDEVKKVNYLTEKDKKGLITTIIEPIKHYKSYKKTYHEVLFKFMYFVSTLEKIKNLFLWTDPLPSFYFMILLIAVLLIVYSIEFRYIMLFTCVKKFISGINYFKEKYRNNLEVATIILKHCQSEWRAEMKNKSKNNFPVNQPIINDETKELNTKIDNIGVYDEKFKSLIKDNLEKHADILIKPEFLNSVSRMGDIRDEIAKCRTLLKLHKASSLFHHTKDNMNIYNAPIEPEDIFIYFVQNVKSDYYISKHYLNEKTVTDADSGSKYISLSSENFDRPGERKGSLTNK